MREKKEHNFSVYYIIVGVVLVLFAMVLLFFFFLRGETKISGSYPDDKTSMTLSCRKINYIYPFADLSGYVDPESSSVDINVIFDNNKLSSMSMVYMLNYTKPEDAAGVKGRLSFTVKKHMDLYGPGSGNLESNFIFLNNVVRMNLYATTEDLNMPNSKKYFLINGDPVHVVDYLENYRNQGFECMENVD